MGHKDKNVKNTFEMNCNLLRKNISLHYIDNYKLNALIMWNKLILLTHCLPLGNSPASPEHNQNRLNKDTEVGGSRRSTKAPTYQE